MSFGTSRLEVLGVLWAKLSSLIDGFRPPTSEHRSVTVRDERRNAAFRDERRNATIREDCAARTREVSNDLDASVVRLVTIAFLVAVLFSSPRVTVNAVPQTFNAERALLEDANRERVAQGLAPLRWNANLAAAAHAHALQMVQHNTLSHQFAGEAPLQDRARSAGARFTEVAENVAEGPSAEMIHASWMHSPPHRANLLDPELTDIGIAVAVGAPGPGSGRAPMLFAVQDFSQAVPELSLNEQEQQVASALAAHGLRVTNLVSNPGSAPAVKRSSKHSATLRYVAATSSDIPGTIAIGGVEDARKTCGMDHGWAGPRPGMIARYESGNLSRLPENLEQKISGGRFRTASVGACDPTSGSQGFARFRVAILLY
jgi:uncharacterized protein YkwD